MLRVYSPDMLSKTGAVADCPYKQHTLKASTHPPSLPKPLSLFLFINYEIISFITLISSLSSHRKGLYTQCGRGLAQKNTPWVCIQDTSSSIYQHPPTQHTTGHRTTFYTSWEHRPAAPLFHSHSEAPLLRGSFG